MIAAVVADEQYLDMFGLINILYTKADANLDLVIDREEMVNIFATMDRNNNSKVELVEFINEWSLLDIGDDISAAYFNLFDIDGNDVLNHVDYSRLYLMFDSNGDGVVTDSEFDVGLQKMYHRVPFVRLFTIVDKGSNNDHLLTLAEFSSLFESFVEEADMSIALGTFQKHWVDSRFGSPEDAENVFVSFDSNRDGNMTVAEVKDRFVFLDKTGDNKLEMAEVEQLADFIPIIRPT